ncbi:hypothetical protein RhiirC2_804647 [Rhizophagus irregularis]|uniref:Uncharacterized protein n=1 Tax=Rhizophagus irregularis TaxID=588596 RepID=A0A2N1KXS6_9GLOM|nr:hypothetical protein RhiirC2_804647 [Rhizophagus irregularis]
MPGSSRTVSSRGSSQAGSQQEPILISLNEDITIKMEKSDTTVTSGISEKGEESAVTSATNEKYRGKVPVQSSSDDSSDSDSSYSSNSSNTSFYLTKSDMPKYLREALRVNKDIPN